MEETQSFRVLGEKDVEEITFDQVDGQDVIYWEDIVHVFPTVKHVKNGNINVKLLRDSKRIRFAKSVHWGTREERKKMNPHTDKEDLQSLGSSLRASSTIQGSYWMLSCRMVLLNLCCLHQDKLPATKLITQPTLRLSCQQWTMWLRLFKSHHQPTHHQRTYPPTMRPFARRPTLPCSYRQALLRMP